MHLVKSYRWGCRMIFAIAIEEGATMIRIGTALVGEEG
jgi:uncharacterized pyridoxal phosphate-containing UPF0001 family protein